MIGGGFGKYLSGWDFIWKEGENGETGERWEKRKRGN